MPVTNLGKNINLLVEWFPVVALFTALGEAKQGVPRALAFLQLAQFVASKTQAKQDDELLKLIEEIVLTEPGRLLIDYLSDQIGGLLEQVNATNKRLR